LPSTRKRISSGCAGTGRTAVTFLGSFDRDLRDGDSAFFVTRGFCGDCSVAGLADFGLRLRGGIRFYLLRRWPGVATSISKRFEDAAVETAQNVSHQIDRAVGEEIGAMNVSDTLLEKAGTIHVPDIVRR
jgi:hypothetical protein